MRIYELRPYGYCYGVINAIRIIEEVKQRHKDKNVYVFGMLVHNNDVVKYLETLDIVTIDTTIIDKEKRLREFTSNDVVVFTAHGHDKKYDNVLKENNVTYYDATCKNVLKNMELINENLTLGQVIYIGKKNHPEAEANLCISENVILYDIKDGIDYSKIKSERIFVTNQTTLSFLEIEKIHKDIKEHIPTAIFANEICSSARVRQENIMNYEETADLIVIIGSIHSSNTDKLYQIASNKFSKSEVIKVENLEDLKKYDVSKYKSALITSGTSTPLKSIIDIKEYLGGI